MKIKRITALLLALLICAICFYGCGNTKTEDEPKTERKQSEKRTTGMDKFEITYYYGPSGEQALDESFWQKVAECGFTTVPLSCNSVEESKTALSLMKKYGLTCSVLGDSRISSIVYSDNEYTQEEVDEVVKEVVADYDDCDNITGWNLIDEPTVSRFHNLGLLVDAFGRFDGERTTSINLFPNYASDEQLGCEGYDNYLTKFVEEVKPDYISYDHYHFYNDGSKRDCFFTNFESIRSVSIQNNLDYMLIVLLTRHFNYADLTYEQINWEVNMSLAYGAKQISYFTFILSESLISEGWSNSCMSYTGEIYPHYYDVQKINKTLINLGSELFNKNSKAVCHISETLESSCRMYNSGSYSLGKINGTDLTVGIFDDNSYMIVNEDYSSSMQNSFTLDTVTEGLEYFDAESAEWKACGTRNGNGLYLFRLDPGAAVLIRTAE